MTQGVSTGQASGASGADWIARLDAGQISRTEAIEGLVADAVEAGGGASLPEAQRAELAGVLREALLEDPVLAALLAP